MRPTDYRLKSYHTKQNNFYNGTLSLGFMNNLNDNISIKDIYEAQKNAIITYNRTIDSKRLKLLNYDLLRFNSSLSLFDKDTNTIVNSLNKKLDQVRQDYVPTVSQVRKQNIINPEEITALKKQINNLFFQYTKILQTIQKNSINSDGFQNQTILTQLLVLEEKIQKAQSVITQYEGSAVLGNEIAGYFWQISNMFSKIQGFQLEEDVVNTANSWLPTGMKISHTGNIRLNGSELAVDNMVFSELVFNIPFEYERAPQGQKNKVPISGTIGSFLDDLSKNRVETFYLKDSSFEQLCRNSLATIQAKAMGTSSKTMWFNRDVQLFTSRAYNSKKGLLSSFTLTYKKYSTEYLRAIIGMKNLYELSAKEHKGTSNYKQAAQQYQTFINYSLHKMIPMILKNNQFLLSNKYGLISFADFFKYNHNIYFSWGKNKTANLTKLDTAKYDILLNIS